jgi:hypothetical protein
MDSAQHLKASLDELVKITPPDEFKNFRKLELNDISSDRKWGNGRSPKPPAPP